MEVEPGYKHSEAGTIPDDWDIKPLESLARLERGKFSARPRNDPRFFGGDIPFIQTGDVANSDGEIRTYSQTLNEAGLRVSKRFPKGTMFFTIAANIGDVAFAHFDAACPDSLVAITPLSGVDGYWLAYELRRRKSAFESLASQNAQMNINLEKLRPYLVPVPVNRAEQEAIAQALSDADALIASLERLLAKKRDIKQGVMQEMLTGKRRLPGFNGDWQEKPLGQLFTFSGGYTASREQLSTEGHCYLHYGDIHKSAKSFIDVSVEFADIPKLDIPLNLVRSSALLGDGDVVFVDASEDDEGTSKHVVVVNKGKIPFISGLHTIVAKAKTDELTHEYRRYCFQTRAVRDQFLFYAVGTKVSGISKGNVGKIVILVPPKREQTAIAAVLSDIDAELETIQVKLAKARFLKQGMAQELLTGRIRLK